MTNFMRIKGNDNQELSLEFNNEHLGDFISKLLGQPQSLSKTYNKPFKADHAYIKNLLSLIFQRLEQQNEYELLDFIAKINFTDGSERKLSSIKSFDTYSEVRYLISVRLYLNISLLIKFPSKDIPERQDISLIFNSNLNSSTLESNEVEPSEVIVEIKHTERTWADDMLTMIEKSLNSIWIEEKFITKTMMNFIGVISSTTFMLLSFLVVMIFLYYQIYLLKDVSNSIQTSYPQNKNIDLSLINEKLDFIFNTVSSSKGEANGGLKLLNVVMLLPTSSMIILLLKRLTKPYYSYLILTESTKIHMNNNILKAKNINRFIGTIIMLIITLGIGILSTYIYNKIT